MRADEIAKNAMGFPVDCVKSVSTLKGLATIVDDGVEGVIVDRPLPAFVAEDLRKTSAPDVPDLRVDCKLGEVESRALAFLAQRSTKVDASARWISADIAKLARQFAHILSVERVSVRIEHVQDDACRKFHRDTVRARLICTYQGPGTEYGYSLDGQAPRRLYQVPTGQPMLLKGKLWSGASGVELLHRSPPIENTGIVRLVVVIDEAPRA